MPIVQTTRQSDIAAYIAQSIERRKKAIVNTMKYVGELCVNNARRLGSYKDQTGNLRSSVGYVVVCDGRIESSSTPEGMGEDGKAKGVEYARQLAKGYPQGVVLIVVAGMNYAACVAAKGYNVIASAELLAEQEVPRLMKRLGLIV